MSEFLNTIQDYLWLFFILAVFIMFAIPQFIDLGKSISLFFQILLSPKKETILGLVRKLMSLPDDIAFHLASKVVVQGPIHENFDDLIRRFTSIVDKPIGINDVKTGKVTTKFYVDFIAACCDAVVLKRLAVQLAYFVIETLEKKDYSFDYIISLSRSNVLIGLEVSRIIEKPFIVIGPTAGADLPHTPLTRSGGALRYVLVDGIISTGEEVLNIARNVKAAGCELRFVFVVMDRCFHAKDRLREQSPFDHPLELFSLCEYDDKKISAILKQKSH